MNDDKLTEALGLFCDALESAVIQLRQNLNVPQRQDTRNIASKVDFDVSRIAWTKAEGSKGPYEKSVDLNNRDFQALLGWLKEEKGQAKSLNGCFYWVFPDGQAVGRKPRENKPRRR